MSLDPTTGLPYIPWPDHFWRAGSTRPMETTYYHIELRKKKKFLGLEYSTLVKQQIMLEMTPQEMRKRAYEILDKLGKAASNAAAAEALLGDYPPKSLNS